VRTVLGMPAPVFFRLCMRVYVCVCVYICVYLCRLFVYACVRFCYACVYLRMFAIVCVLRVRAQT